ncbi:MAG: DUF4296 domain-containing protein [Bacteroidales bacterium]|nr:DUF4296 domain-containing protein [Bacteroidales bacterium]
MERLRVHVLLLLLLAVLSGAVAGCGRVRTRGRIIPRPVMVRMLSDMFLADRWLIDHPDARQQADTTDFYGPIFQKYGYSFVDYDASIRFYLRDPEKFSALFKRVADRLRRSGRRYSDLQERMEAIAEYNAGIRGYQWQDIGGENYIWDTPDAGIAYDEIAVPDSLDTDDEADHIPVYDTWECDTAAVPDTPVDSLQIKEENTLQNRIWNTHKDSAILHRRKPLPEASSR